LPLLDELAVALENLGDWTAPAIHGLIHAMATAKGVGLGKLAQPLRLAMSGGTVSPPIDATLAILGKEQVLLRLAAARAAWSAGPSG
jgi:glutamyl-tRNA synthetase